MAGLVWVKTFFGQRRHLAEGDRTACGQEGGVQVLTANTPSVLALPVCRHCQRITGMGN